MKLLEGIEMQGRLKIQVWNGRRQLVEEHWADNDIVFTGRDLVARLFVQGVGETVGPISHLAVGSGETAVNPTTDTQLKKEIFRKTIDSVAVGETPAPKKAKVTVTTELDFHEGNGELREAGLFNTATPENSIMYNRVVFPAINKTNDFQLTLVWEIIF